ncbi:MAG: M50 family metallopeptidase [Candidatus Shapirobacteria bacterium]|jgi:regulator of sigma E protease
MDILIFIIALSILVLVHEFGHYFAAIKTGVKVEEFGLGLPPRIVGKKFGGTIFSLNWLPIGGFCKLYGEDGDGKGGVAFNNKKPWQKMMVVLGGVLMNLVLAIAIFSFVYSVSGVPTDIKVVKIIGITGGSPAEMAGLKEGDSVVEVEGKPVFSAREMTDEVAKYKGQEISLEVESLKVEREVKVFVRENPPAGEGGMGVTVSNTEMVPMKWYEIHKGIGAGFREAYYWGKIIGSGVIGMVSELFQGRVPKDVSGPIGMFQATSSIKQNQGMLAVVHFFAIVSVNLAVVNILPFPALDGGRIIFVVYEMIFRKRVNQKFETAINNFGMVVLLFLIFLITAGDVVRIFK